LLNIKHQASIFKEVIMRTTLNLDDDVFFEAKNIASTEQRSIGSVLSDLVRRALNAPEQVASETQNRTVLDAKLLALGVVPYYAASKRAVNNEMVNKLKDELDV
jgi:negative regulator of replication initiation